MSSSSRKYGGYPGLTRRGLGGVLAGAAAVGSLRVPRSLGATSDAVNSPRTYPVRESSQALDCVVDVAAELGTVDRRIFGTNLEWFNEGGGLDSSDLALRQRLWDLAGAQKLSVLRFPGGTLADYYDWRDGIGPRDSRPVRPHPTDSGRSGNGFGSPEFFHLLRATGAQGLITVNAGTSTPQEAAAWVAYANQPGNAQRAADGFPAPIGIKLWEVGNELYFPGNPGERKIGQTPDEYAANFLQFADAIRGVDPNVTVIAIGVAKSHAGPDTPYPDWTEKLLAAAAAKIDMVAVHNAYFPFLYNVLQPAVEDVYPALWAGPEAVDRSLTTLESLLDRYETGRPIGIALTEWGPLFSIPALDPYWFDHVKTLGAGVFVARMMQVLISHPRVQLANYFKFTDRTFMGWVAFDGVPKVPYWVFRLYAQTTGDRRVAATIDSPTYDAPAMGVMVPEAGVPEVSVVATRDSATGVLSVNFVNRSLTTAHRIRLHFPNGRPAAAGQVRAISAREPTAHNGVDIPPEQPMRPEYEPYTTAPPGSIAIDSRRWSEQDLLTLPPFSVASLVLAPDGARP